MKVSDLDDFDSSETEGLLSGKQRAQLALVRIDCLPGIARRALHLFLPDAFPNGGSRIRSKPADTYLQGQDYCGIEP